MSELLHNKLVRDGIPAIIESDGHRAVLHIVQEADRDEVILDKVQEELAELRAAQTPQDILAERADIEEALQTYDARHGLTAEAIEKARALKFARRGGFGQFVFLEKEIIND